MYFYDLNLGPPGAGQSSTLGPSFKKNGKGLEGNATYQISRIKHLSQVVLEMKIVEYFFIFDVFL